MKIHDLRMAPELLEQAPPDPSHKMRGMDSYIARSDKLEEVLYKHFGRWGLCLKIFVSPPPEDPLAFRWGGSLLTECTRVQNFLAYRGLSPRVYAIVRLNWALLAQVTDYAPGLGAPQYDKMERVVRKYRLGIKGKKGDPVEQAVKYTRLWFKWVGHWFVDFGRFYFTDPKGYLAQLRAKIQHRRRGPGGSKVGYQELPELGIPGQRKHSHRLKHLRLDEIDFRGKNVLDLGCNLGSMCREAVDRGARRVVGVDYRRVSLWQEANNWLGYWGIDFLPLTLPHEAPRIWELLGIRFDVVFALAIVQHIEGGYGPWLADLCREVLYLEGGFQHAPGFTRTELERDFERVELLGYIRDEDKRDLYRCWKSPRPPAQELPRPGPERLEAAVGRGRHIQGRVMINDDRELEHLYKLALIAPDGPAVEVGVMCGGSFVCWTGARPEGSKLYAVDIEDRQDFRDNLQHYGIEATVLIGDSAKVSVQIPDGLAFCFIDADHTAKAVIRDIAAYAPKIAPGGVLAFHDYDWNEAQKGKGYGVYRAVNSWQAKARWEDLGQEGLVKAFRRPSDTLNGYRTSGEGVGADSGGQGGPAAPERVP